MTERPLYTILELNSTATADEIKHNYRRLALQYHPDKAGPSGEERFKQIQAAYSVLSDPAKRQIYDKYGEQGLSQLGSAPEGLGELLIFMSAANLLAGLMFAALIAFILTIIFMAFLCAKVEDRVEWRWTSVFVPLYILDVFVAIVGFLALGKSLAGCCVPSGNSEDDAKISLKKNFLSQVTSFFGAITILGWVVFAVTVSAGLQRRSDGHDVNWWYYFVPVLVAEISSLIQTLLSVPQIKEILMMQGIAAHVSGCSLGALITFQILSRVCRVIQIFLICARVTDDITSSWWAVFVPFYIMFFFVVLSQTTLAYIRTAAIADAAGAEVAGMGACSTCYSMTFAVGLPLATVLMIAAKLEGDRDIPLEQCFIPLFLIIGSVMCTLMCSGIMLCVATKSMEDDINVMEQHAAAEANRNEQAAAAAATSYANNANATAAPGQNDADVSPASPPPTTQQERSQVVQNEANAAPDTHPEAVGEID